MGRKLRRMKCVNCPRMTVTFNAVENATCTDCYRSGQTRRRRDRRRREWEKMERGIVVNQFDPTSRKKPRGAPVKPSTQKA